MKRAVIAECRNSTELIENEKQIRAQNKGYYRIYDKIAKKIPKDEQMAILKTNKQLIPETDTQVNSPQTQLSLRQM